MYSPPEVDRGVLGGYINWEYGEENGNYCLGFRV